ncbi:MAG: HD domain-containing protein [Planctomycetota bacterium]|jgi:HD superfamily phosphohydrolase
MDATHFKIVVDPLYGVLHLDEFSADIVSRPDLQRLREVRLSNINSLLLPGSANISRFEHSVGVGVLARELGKILSLAEAQSRLLTCAALLHDVAIPPFGHLMEEGFRYARKEFDHERLLEQVFLGDREVGNIEFQIYRGKTVGFRKVLERKKVRRLGLSVDDVFHTIQGKGILGQLLNGTVDLDNADNVTRMAYHLGLHCRKELPQELIRGFLVDGGVLCYETGLKSLLEEWLELRSRLYNVFMTNPVDFSAKAMLVEAVRLGLVGTEKAEPILSESHWVYTDSELLSALREYDATADLIRRLELGDFCDLIGLYWVDAGDDRSELLTPGRTHEIRADIAAQVGLPSAEVIVYLIKDKRSRALSNLIFRDKANIGEEREPEVGVASEKVLLGAVVQKRGVVDAKRERLCREHLESVFGPTSVNRCDPREHLLRACGPENTEATKQARLF